MSKPGVFIPEHISSIDYDLLCDYAEEQYAKIKAKSMPAMRKSAQTTPPSVATRSTSGRAHSPTTQTSPLGAPADPTEATLQDSIKGYFDPLVDAEFHGDGAREYNVLKKKDTTTEYRKVMFWHAYVRKLRAAGHKPVSFEDWREISVVWKAMAKHT